MKPLAHDTGPVLTRRRFVVGGLAVTAFGAFAPSALARPFGASRDERERILVVVQLTGGNDGLNTLIPIEQDAWYRARPSLSRVAKGSHALGAGQALHPAMGALAERFHAGEFTCLHGVGYPNPDRSHFRSMDVWHSASLATNGDGRRPTGWLARLGEQVLASGGGTPAMLHVGGGALPRSLVGRAGPAPSLEALDQLRPPDGAQIEALFAALYSEGEARGEAAFLRSAARDAVSLGRRLEDRADAPLAAAWPQDPFARDLALVARLVRSDLGARIYQVELDGFDTHRGQVTIQADLLGRLSSGLAAFQAELRAAGRAEDVLTFVFSEFGRRVRENASGGTDHGAGAPAFVVGPRASGGFVGTAPDLERLVDGDVPHSIDFRSVYTALECDWMGLEPSTDLAALEILR